MSWSNLKVAYGIDKKKFANAIIIYLTTWSIVTFLFVYVLIHLYNHS
jgi:GPR1/FUN34/yaaH family